MATSIIRGTFATFGKQGETFEEANNNLSAAFVSTRGNGLSWGDLSLNSSEPLSGQSVYKDTEQELHTVYQSILKFEIPLARIKTLQSAQLRFYIDRSSKYKDLITYYTNEFETDPELFNIRAVGKFKHYPPADVVTKPLLGSFLNNASYQSIDIIDPTLYFNDYNFYILVSQTSQEQNIPRLTPETNIERWEMTEVTNVELRLEHEEYTVTELKNKFKHFELVGSGIIEAPAGSNSSIYVLNSGFVKRDIPETVGSVIFFSGSGQRTRRFDISCYDRLLTFAYTGNPDIGDAVTETVELIFPPEFTGTGTIEVCRWYNEPNINYPYDYSVLSNFTGGVAQLNIQLEITPSERWIHFQQYDPARGRVVPIRVEEKDGKLVAIGF